MKLNLFFIAMDLLTLLIYPVLFVYGGLRRLVKVKESIMQANPLPVILAASDKWQA